MTVKIRQQMKAMKQTYVQDEIVLAAVGLIAKRGYRAVTLDDIASSLGYTKSIIYYYFKSKSEILSKIFVKNYDIYFEKIDETMSLDINPAERMRRVIYDHAMNIMLRPDWSAIYWRDEGELDAKQRKSVLLKKSEYGKKVKAIYAQGMEAGLFKRIPNGLAVRALFGMCNSLYTWYQEGGSLSAEEIANYFASILMYGFLDRSERKN